MDESLKPIKVTFAVTESEYDRLYSALTLGKHDFLCFSLDHVQHYSNSSRIYLECTFLEVTNGSSVESN